jgi:ATP-dependent exoDNAse (exonuclease V) beta subunit
MPFVVLTANHTLQRGIIDAVFECPDGTLWVVDYKTDQVKPGQEASLFAQKYAAQLTAYREAARKIFPGKKIRVSSIFLRTFAAIDL